jgi:crotonobetainyl-CoA:carnitine CoA-transferase CaiB-like acyl-CoA transferase
VRFDEPVDIRPTPALGEHTAEVLAELERGVRRD